MIEWKKFGKDESKVLSSINELIRLFQDSFYKNSLNGRHFTKQKLDSSTDQLILYHKLGRIPLGWKCTRTKGIKPVEISKDKKKIVFGGVLSNHRKLLNLHPFFTPLPKQDSNATTVSDIETVGNLAYLTFQDSPRTDPVFVRFKVPNDYVQDTAKVHVHWTKNDDENREGYFVKWRIRWSAYNGTTEEATGASSPYSGTETIEDVVNNDQTTGRIVQRAPDGPSNDLQLGSFPAGYYISLRIDGQSPSKSPELADVGLVSVDLTYDSYLNANYTDEQNEFDIMVF